MEPIILATAILSQFQTSTLIGTLVGGVIGNRTDFWLCKGTNILYKRIRSTVGKPENHDIQKAVRKSYVSATLLAVEHTQSQYKLHHYITSGKPSELREVKRYLRQQLADLNKSNTRFPETDFDTDFQPLISPTGQPATERLPEMTGSLKRSVLAELEHKKYFIDEHLRTAILEGWQDKDQPVDWYKLTCAFFAEELKTNPRISSIIQTQYLDEIKHSTDELNIVVDQLVGNLEGLRQEYQLLLTKVDEILSVVADNNEMLHQLPADFRQVVKEELDKRKVGTELPDFTVPGRHQKLLEEIGRLSREEKEVKVEIEDDKNEVKEAKEEEKRARKQRSLTRAETRFVEIAQQKENAENELQTFIGNVLKLAEQFAQQSGPTTPRLDQARALFAEGRYEEVDAVLNEREIYDDIDKHREKAKELAEELTVKAQTTLVNKPEGWFELADKYYHDAANINERYDTCFTYAYYLQEHRQIVPAIEWYQKTRRYTENDYQRSAILNNLANLQADQNDYGKAEPNYQEALQHYRTLAEVNPQTYLPYVAATLNNLAILQKNKNDYGKAEPNYQEALQLRSKLAEDNPQRFLLDYATTAVSLAMLYRYNLVNRDKSIHFAEVAIQGFAPFAEVVPFAAKWKKVAEEILKYWKSQEE